MPETRGPIPRWEGSLGEENGAHFSILAWRLPWTEEAGGLQSVEVTKNRTGLSNCRVVNTILCSFYMKI